MGTSHKHAALAIACAALMLGQAGVALAQSPPPPPSNHFVGGQSPGHVDVWTSYELQFDSDTPTGPDIGFYYHALWSKSDDNDWVYKDVQYQNPVTWDVINQGYATVYWKDIAWYNDYFHQQMIGEEIVVGAYISP